MTTKTDHLKLLRKYGLKPTCQRLFLSEIIFSGKDMHFCAEDLGKIVLKKGFKMSLATIYNNLHQLVDVGLLKKRQINNNRTYFDNNVTDHFHIFDEENNTLIDIPYSSVKFSKFPKLPKNKKIKNISLVINLENK
jgi:Fe2+/Zn2+ uptake regulation proteins